MDGPGGLSGSPTILFLHGWGFDSSVWNELARALGNVAAEFADLGYFGRPHRPKVQGPVVAVGHSLGSLLLLKSPPDDCRALVAINGFDHFTSNSGSGGAHPRLIGRMMSRFGAAPRKVLADFRKRCGVESAAEIVDAELLQSHLSELRDADEREQTRCWERPILSLQADDDPILPPALRESVFATGSAVRREAHPDGGHVLPLTQPAWCAAHIRSLIAEL